MNEPRKIREERERYELGRDNFALRQQGYSLREIATMRGCSAPTVARHIRHFEQVEGLR